MHTLQIRSLREQLRKMGPGGQRAVRAVDRESRSKARAARQAAAHGASPRGRGQGSPTALARQSQLHTTHAPGATDDWGADSDR